MDYVLAVPAACVGVTALVLALFGQRREQTSRAQMAACGAIALALGILVRLGQWERAQSLLLVRWIPLDIAPVDLALQPDSLGLLMAVISCLVCLAALGPQWNPPGKSSETDHRVAPALGLLAALLLAVLSRDLLVAYVGFELVSLAVYWIDRGSGRANAASAYAVAHVANYALLAAALLVYQGNLLSGSRLVDTTTALGGAMPLLFAVAALGRLAQIGVSEQIWRGPVAGLYSALGGVGATYILFRSLEIAGGAWPSPWGGLATWSGGLLLLVSAGRALGARGLSAYLDRFAWADVGVLLVAIGLGTPLSLAAGLLQMVNKAFVLPALSTWLASSNKARQSKWLLAGLAVGSLAGAPPLIGFSARWLLCAAAWEEGQWLLVLTIGLVAMLATPAGVKTVAIEIASPTRVSSAEAGTSAGKTSSKSIGYDLAARYSAPRKHLPLATSALAGLALLMALVPAVWIHVIGPTVQNLTLVRLAEVRELAPVGGLSPAFLIVLVTSTLGLGIGYVDRLMVPGRLKRRRPLPTARPRRVTHPLWRSVFQTVDRWTELAGIVERNYYLPAALLSGLAVIVAFAS